MIHVLVHAWNGTYLPVLYCFRWYNNHCFILSNYKMILPKLAIRPFSLQSISYVYSNALEARLIFSIHPFIIAFLRWRRISPLYMVPNFWCYLVAFIGEVCNHQGMIPSLNIFPFCFRDCHWEKGYYLTSRLGFKVSGAPTSNKGWKSRFLFIQLDTYCGFSLVWSTYTLSNPILS